MSSVQTVLIIDDDVPFADFVRATVESVGHRVVVVTNGAQALEAFIEHQPSLVLLDLLLPKRDGFKVCQDIRAHPDGRATPIVMMTGIYKKAVYERDGLEKHGASAYVFKPFGVREIWNLLERFLGAPPVQAREDGPPALTTAQCESLEGTPLPALLARHVREASTGVLFVRGTDVTYVVYLQAGEIIFLRSNDPEDRLDRVLLRTAKVTTAQVQCALDSSGESRGRTRLGEALVSQGALTRESLETALQLQLQLIARRAAGLAHGHCLFVAGEHPTEEDVHLRGPSRALLFRSALHAGSDAAVKRSLPEGEARLARTEAPAELVATLALGADEDHLLHLADDGATVERFLGIAAAAGLDGPRLLLGFTASDIIRAEAPAPRERIAPAAWDPKPWVGQPFGAALASAVMARVTGALSATAPDCATPREILLRDGAVVGALSARPSDRLHRVLPHLEIVEPGPLGLALEPLGADPSDDAVAAAVRAAGLLSPTEVYWARTYQVHAIVHALLQRRDVGLSWSPGPLPEERAILPDVPTAELVIDGIACCEAATLEALLPPAGSWAEPVEDAQRRADDLPLPDAIRASLASLGTGVAARAWLAAVGSPAALAERRIHLATLLATGLVLTRVGAGRGASTVPELVAATEPATRRRVRVEDAHDPQDLVVDLEALSAEVEAPPAPAAMPPAPAPERPAMEVVARPSGTARTSTEASTAGAARAPGQLDFASRLATLDPLLRVLRCGFGGTERRVQVDRERMAELFDQLLALTEAAKGGTTPEDDEPVLTAVGATGRTARR